MSATMLEQAIVDAQTLRQAALQSAESEVVEKYASEVKEAVEKILEQDDELGADLGLGAEADPLADPQEEESEVMDQIPTAHDLEGSEEEIVTIDLDQIIAAADAEEGEEEYEMDAAEVADEVGLELSDEEAAVANRRDDDVEISESELVDMFTELLVIDIGEKEEDEAEHLSDVEEEGEDIEDVLPVPRDDGMDAKDVENQKRLATRLDNLAIENKDLKTLLSRVKDRLQEVNLSNARLLYANRVLQDTSLNEQQKNKIVGMVSEARSVDEAKMLYETLQKTLASTPTRKTPQSLSEVVSRSSSLILSGRREKADTSDTNPVLNRWATLAGINNQNK